mgnify:CR=1 FL=1
MRHLSIYFDEICKEHENGPGHPERPERLDAALKAVDTFPWPEAVELRQPADADHQAIRRVHDGDYVDSVAATAESAHTAFDMDTAAGPHSHAAALRAAGGAIAVADGALKSASNGDGEVPVALLRPPGHHAEATRAMGFCLFNNVAVAAAHAREERGVSRVAILDWDVHHGNGTQHIFETDPGVLYLSVHEYPLFPGTGRIEEVGMGEGEGYTVNVPLPAGQYDAQYLRVFREIFEPVLRSYRPELILISAGFDAHADDPLANMSLSADGFGLLTGVVMEWAAAFSDKRIGFVLEGGYNLAALTESLQAVMTAVIDQSGLHEEDAYGASLTRADRTIAEVKRVQSAYWPSITGG